MSRTPRPMDTACPARRCVRSTPRLALRRRGTRPRFRLPSNPPRSWPARPMGGTLRDNARGHPSWNDGRRALEKRGLVEEDPRILMEPAGGAQLSKGLVRLAHGREDARDVVQDAGIVLGESSRPLESFERHLPSPKFREAHAPVAPCGRVPGMVREVCGESNLRVIEAMGLHQSPCEPEPISHQITNPRVRKNHLVGTPDGL